MYSNISQILLLYKTWRYDNQFDSPKSLGVCYWCVKIPQCGYMDHELKHISFYVQKRVVAMGMCYNPALVRNKPLRSPSSVKWVYWPYHKESTRADSWFAPRQWEMALRCNDVSHWLGASLESALKYTISVLVTNCRQTYFFEFEGQFHYSYITGVSWYSKPLATRLCVNIKGPPYWLFVPTGDWWIPLTKGQ